MSNYQEGYDYYVLKCKEFGIEPINLYHYLKSLSEEQLAAFNDRADR